MTAEEKLKANFYNGSFIEIHSGDLDDIKRIMIEFAKYHVELALKAASETKLEAIYNNTGLDEERYGNDKQLILHAYPLKNIK